MMFDVRRNVLVMRMRTGKFWYVRMRLGIVPEDFFGVLPNLIAIRPNKNAVIVAGQSLFYDNSPSCLERKFPLKRGDRFSASNA